jgi:diadenosine tetraphosphate (Ap4A) HIT family hydrolase
MKNFYELPKDRWIRESDRFFVIKDGFPVSRGHCLIVAKELRQTFFDLTREERIELLDVIDEIKKMIDEEYSPDGYNIGMNCGEVAGQSVMHFHCHVIPRYRGDMENPKGGIRYCIPTMGAY